MIEQQDLLRAAIKGGDFSRKSFAQHLGVAERRLATWLVPSDSSNFRKAPADVLGRIESELLGATSDADWASDSAEFDHLRIEMERHGSPLRFPCPLMVRQEGPSFNILHAGNDLVSMPDGGTLISEQVVLAKNVPYVKVLDATSTHFEPLTKAVCIEGEPVWIFITHIRSAQALEGYMAAIGNVQDAGRMPEDDGLMQLQRVTVDNDLFVMTTLPAPDYYPHPLLIYRAERLVMNPYVGITPNDWVHCIDQEGTVLDSIPAREMGGSGKTNFFAVIK